MLPLTLSVPFLLFVGRGRGRGSGGGRGGGGRAGSLAAIGMGGLGLGGRGSRGGGRGGRGGRGSAAASSSRDKGDSMANDGSDDRKQQPLDGEAMSEAYRIKQVTDRQATIDKRPLSPFDD